MNKQDFEQYARIKLFNLHVTDVWKQAMRDIVSRVAKPVSEIRLLDYGCGDGKYFGYLMSQGFMPENLHGIDVSRLRVERCQALGWHHAVYIEKGAALPYPDDHFDAVNLMEVIEHVPVSEISKVLDEIRRVIRPNGTILLSTPNYPIKRFYDWYDAVRFQKWIRLNDDPTRRSKRMAAVLLSTGMSYWSEIAGVVEFFGSRGIPLVLMQCTSSYPCPPEKLGLNLIREYARRFQVPAGFSDHSGKIAPGEGPRSSRDLAHEGVRSRRAGVADD